MTYIVAILVAIVMAIGGGWLSHRKGDAAGFERRDLACRAEVADIRSHAEEVARQAQAEREKGRLLADKLATQLAETRDRLSASQRSLHESIRLRASVTHRAVSSDVTRMLNEAAEIRVTVEPIDPGRAAASRIAAPDGAVAEDRSGPRRSASERAIATWGAQMIEYAQTCRATLTALQTWARSVTQ